jgi:dTDP-4-dehydrorhamnose reductase
VVTDQIMTPTYAGHLARALVPLLAAADDGLFHLTNSGSCSWWEFARAILRRAGLPDQIEPVTSRDYGAAAPRPAYSVLASRRGSSPVAPLPSWEEGLEAYFQERAQRRNGVRVEF